MLSFSLPAHMNDEFNMHKSTGDCDYSMLMAIIHVQMAAARYRGDINTASLFPTPAPLSCSPVSAVHKLQFIKWSWTLWRKVRNLLGYKGVPEIFSFDITVKLQSNLAKQLSFKKCLVLLIPCNDCPEIPLAPHRLCPRSSLLPSSWCGPGHNDGVQRVTSPTTVPIGNVLRAHGWKNRHCLMELDETFSCLGSREGFIKKIYQKAGLGKTIRERSTSESAPIWSKLMVLHAWPCFFFFF